MRNAKTLLATMAVDTNYGEKTQEFFKLVGEQGVRSDINLTTGNCSLIMKKRDYLARHRYKISTFTIEDVLIFASWINSLAGQPEE